MNLTAVQQSVVDHRGSHLLVTASAGSGKTEVLSRRCLALLADAQHPVGVDQLLVVTFTRAAAAELRTRIARLLHEAAAECGSGPQAARLRRQATLLVNADIGTIDAWCARVLRENFVQAGVDPGFTLLTEEAAQLLMSEVLEGLMNWVYESGDPVAVDARNWVASGREPSDAELRTLIASLNAYREHLVNPEFWLRRVTERVTGSPVELRCRSQEVLAAGLAAECTELADGLRFAASGADAAAYQTQLERWATQLRDASRLESVIGEIEAYSLASRGGQWSERLSKWLKRQQERWSAARITNLLDHSVDVAHYVRLLVELEGRYESRLRAARQQRNVLTFAEVLRSTLDLLGEPGEDGRRPTELARRLQERYEHILVDEYQDTSPVQVAILELVSRGAPRGNRCLVGDVKQSVYGFRQAEPRLFAELADRFAASGADGQLCTLSENFRSHARLLEGLNEIFACLFERNFGGADFSQREHLVARRTECPNPSLDGAPRIIGQFWDQDDPHADEVDNLEDIEREAAWCAEEIQRLLRTAQVPERDAQGDVRPRPIRLRDVVVLLRSARYNADAVAARLRESGVAALADARDAIFESVEVNDVLSILRVIVNPRQDVALAAHLRSPACGVTWRELQLVRTSFPGSHLIDSVRQFVREPTDKGLAERIQGALGALERWRRSARHQDARGVLRQVMTEIQQVRFARGLPQGMHREGLLHTLEAIAADYVRSGSGGLPGLVEHLDGLTHQDLPPTTFLPAAEDAVRVMTIHAAKGLEFPVVFLLNCGGKFNEADLARPLVCDAEAGIGFTRFEASKQRMLENGEYVTIREIVRRRTREEELRLLYVAATRARERFYFAAHVSRKRAAEFAQLFANGAPVQARLDARCMADWLLMALAPRPRDGDPLIEVRWSDAKNDSALAGVAPADKSHISVDVIAHQPQAGSSSNRRNAGARRRLETPIAAADYGWVERALQLIAYEPDLTAARCPAVLSASELKRRLAPDDDDVARSRWAEAELRSPAFAATREHDPLEAGSAVHQFLQHADLAALQSDAGVRGELSRLVDAGRLSARYAGLVRVDAVAWFAQSPLGARLRAANRVFRETPFVYGLRVRPGMDPVLLRGVIDCHFETPAGWVLLDYKSDEVRPAALDQRARLYAAQMQAYGLAVADLWGRPAAEAWLVFLNARQLVAVELAAPDSAEWLRLLDPAPHDEAKTATPSGPPPATPTIP